MLAEEGAWSAAGGQGRAGSDGGAEDSLEEGKLKMGVGGKGTLQAAGVEAPRGWGGQGRAEGAPGSAGTPALPTGFVRTWWGSRAIWWPVGRLQGRFWEGSPGGLGLPRRAGRRVLGAWEGLVRRDKAGCWGIKSLGGLEPHLEGLEGHKANDT